MSTTNLSIITSSAFSNALSNKQAQYSLWFAAIKNVFHEAKAGINPLVDSASNIFSTISQIKCEQQQYQALELQSHLLQEINQFQAHIQQKSYDTDVVLACRYALCATLDEAICNTVWGVKTNWNQCRLLATGQQESSDGKKFFLILDQIQKQPEHYIDLIELMYICLRLGFKGQHRHSSFGLSKLNQITEKLYHQIRLVRGDTSNQLSPHFHPLPEALLEKPANFLKNAVMSVIGTVFICSAIASTFNYLMTTTTQQIGYNAASTQESVTQDGQ